MRLHISYVNFSSESTGFFQQTKEFFYIEAASFPTEIGVRHIIIIWIIDKYKFEL